MVAQELTDIDGVDRSNAEVIATSDEDWANQQGSAYDDLKATLKAEVLAEIARDMAAANSKPALAMKANVAQNFIKDANGQGVVLKHYRCDSAGSVKMIQYDMKRLAEYQDGTRPIPEDKDGNPKNILTLCEMRGEWINWLDGHCYTYTENQNLNIERVQTLPPEKGGMVGIYEDTGGATWACYVCNPPRQFADKTTHDNHMAATHGVVPARA